MVLKLKTHYISMYFRNLQGCIIMYISDFGICILKQIKNFAVALSMMFQLVQQNRNQSALEMTKFI